ncbi:MAG: bifunctional glutamate N-acetyltransferase/amino-acid acetyltransferase ArgJ [bacterium]|nr:bifunctional glutamate N-acetyltransferase/amino-acid acetyltransferase ArgJ [bacterium]PIU25734.1 MAG: ornithine acetyltransferase [Candidatus Atribacteria bacterium CG08_land_8_20_14_0_20_33_29]PIW12064.1 MAG: ornithine acetyltransferase [Candidatus Atribacteria bacterium CG17_big_fil_post_rev_8_21_14_2_50_34_11]
MEDRWGKKDFQVVKEGITYPLGIKAAGINCGIRLNKKDLALIYSDKLADAVAMYTTNKFKAAPLVVTEKNLSLSGGKLKAVLINSGIANACTGEKGLKDAWETVSYVSQGLNIKKEHVAVFSTGKIGEFLPLNKIKAGVEKVISGLDYAGGEEAAEAILTTDTRKKEVAVNFVLGGKEVRIGGMAKGSGMINPHMATMLGLVTSDVSINLDLLKSALRQVVEKTFNMISVDGDTSTNDMVIVMANGLAENRMMEEKDDNYYKFYHVLYFVVEYLAKCIAKDGEGATKMIEVEVKNALSFAEAKKVAKAVINSPLVKTAIFGNDPNWGRILAAVGYCGAEVVADKVDLYLKEKIVENGQPLKFSRQNIHEYLGSSKEIKIVIDLKMGEENATAWGCDLTYDYVKINTKYN